MKEETEAGAVIIDDGTALKAAIIGCDEAIASLGLLLEKVLPKKTESKHYVNRSLEGVPLTERIDEYFNQPNSDEVNRTRVVVLLGMGGGGKSQIALRYCQHSKNNGLFKIIFWVDASSSTSIAKAFADIAEELTGSQPSYTSAVAEVTTSISHQEKGLPVSVEQMVESVKTIIQDLDTPWMFVFDNYDQPDEFQFHGRFKSIRDYWPAGVKGAMLITSRHESCERLGETLHVGRMSNNEACSLLLDHIDNSDGDDQKDAAASVVELLGCLALAVDQAGAYIRSQRLRISYYPAHYQARRKHVLQRIPSGLEWEYRRKFSETGKDTALSVFTTWELSLQCLSGSELEVERKAHFLTVAAFFDTFNIQESLFREYFNKSTEKPDWMQIFSSRDKWDTYKFGDLVTELKELSILESLERNEEGSRLTFHPLVGEWIRIRLSPTLQDIYSVEAVLILHHSLPQKSPGFNEENDVTNLQIFIPHATQCLKNFAEYRLPEHCLGTGELESPTKSFVDFLSDCAMFDEAEKIAMEVLSWKNQHNMPWTRYYLDIAMRLIWIYREKKDTKLIREWTTEIYAQCRELFGDDDELTLSCQNLWGLMHLDMRDLEEAEKILKTNYEKCSSVWGSYSVRAARSQGNLAIVYEDLGKISEAISYITEAFQICRKELGPDNLSTLEMQLYLITLTRTGKPDEALPLALDCVSRIEKRLGISHPKTIRAYFVLSKVYHQLGRYSDNRTLLQMIEKVLEKFNIARGKSAAELYGLLGFSYLEDDEGLAEKKFAQSIAVYRELCKFHTLDCLICINRLTHIYAQRQEYAKAEALWEEAMTSYGRSHIRLPDADERLYGGYYRMLKMQHFFEDASRKAEIRKVAEVAMREKSVTESILAYELHLNVIQEAYSFLEKPNLVDYASCALLELGVWRFGTEGRPSEWEEANASFKLAVQVPLPLVESEVEELEE